MEDNLLKQTISYPFRPETLTREHLWKNVQPTAKTPSKSGLLEQWSDDRCSSFILLTLSRFLSAELEQRLPKVIPSQ